MGSILRNYFEREEILPAIPDWPGESFEQIWDEFTFMVAAGIDDYDTVAIRRLYSKVVAHQVYFQVTAASYRSAAYRLDYNKKVAFSRGFIEAGGAVDARRQAAVLFDEHQSQAKVLANYQGNEAFFQGRADSLGMMANLLSRELTARFSELNLLKRDTE